MGESLADVLGGLVVIAIIALIFQLSFNAIPGVGDIGFFAALGLYISAQAAISIGVKAGSK